MDTIYLKNVLPEIFLTKENTGSVEQQQYNRRAQQFFNIQHNSAVTFLYTGSHDSFVPRIFNRFPQITVCLRGVCKIEQAPVLHSEIKLHHLIAETITVLPFFLHFSDTSKILFQHIRQQTGRISILYVSTHQNIRDSHS